MYTWKAADRGLFELYEDEKLILISYAYAYHADGRRVETRTAERIAVEENGDVLTLKYQAKNGLILTETLTTGFDGAIASCALSDADGNEVETNRLTPLCYKGSDLIPWWDNLFTKSILVPYDNDFWLRYHCEAMHAGSTSYEVTATFDPETREGVLVGALDMDDWKNAIEITPYGTRILEARSGIADAGTHDSLPHGTLIGKSVSSSRFFIKYGPDYRDLLEDYGKVYKTVNPILEWSHGVIYGFNSWGGLGGRIDLNHYELTSKFMRELSDEGFGDGVTYTNLDGGWQRFEGEDMLKIKDEIHAAGHKTGIYDGPFAQHLFGPFADREMPCAPGHKFSEFLVRDRHGDFVPTVDGSYAIDLTHPLWEKYMAWKLDRFIEWGYDYMKVDFLSHGATEGIRYDKSVRTGRQAIKRGYEFIKNYRDEKRIGRPFFISTSIAPVFPGGYGHARRFCCDAFGIPEDIEYILNTQTYAWWMSGNVYAFNDPDHTVLYQSAWMKEPMSEGMARARYTSSAIAGTVMLLSDDYEKEEARERTKKFALNKEVNKVVSSRVAFRPVESNGDSASHFYTGVVDGEQYIAGFSWNKTAPETLSTTCKRAGIEPGIYRDLWTGALYHLEEGVLTWTAQSCDAILLKKEG